MKSENKKITVFEYGLTGLSVREILLWCEDRECRHVSFIVCAGVQTSGKLAVHKSFRAAVNKITSGVEKEVIPTRAWAGTRTFSAIPQLLILTRLSEVVIARMAALSDAFSTWDASRRPPLPEDISTFCGRQAFPELFTTSHEDLMVTTAAAPFASPRKTVEGQERELARRYGIPRHPFYCEPAK